MPVRGVLVVLAIGVVMGAIGYSKLGFAPEWQRILGACGIGLAWCGAIGARALR